MVQPVGEEPCSYHEFYAGLTFLEVRTELRHEAKQVFEEAGRIMFVTRHTVLGRMRQHKLSAYADYSRWMRGSPAAVDN